MVEEQQEVFGVELGATAAEELQEGNKQYLQQVSAEGEGLGQGQGQDMGVVQQKRSKKTPQQVAVLEWAYNKNKHPNEELRQQVMEQTGLSKQQVQTWFNHRRSKDKKQEERKMESGTNENSPTSQGRDQPAPTIQAQQLNPAASPELPPSIKSQPEDQPYQDPLVINNDFCAKNYFVKQNDDEQEIKIEDYTAKVENEKYENHNDSNQHREVEKPQIFETDIMFVARNYIQWIAQVKSQLNFDFRVDGPPIGFVFDESPGEMQGEMSGGKRKRVADGARVQEVDADGNLKQVKRRKADSFVQARANEVEQIMEKSVHEKQDFDEIMLLEQQLQRDNEKARKLEEKLQSTIQKEVERKQKEAERLERLRKKMEAEAMKEEERRRREADKLLKKQQKEAEKLELKKKREEERLEKLRQREVEKQKREEDRLRKKREKEELAEQRKRERDQQKNSAEDKNLSRDTVICFVDDKNLEAQLLQFTPGVHNQDMEQSLPPFPPQELGLERALGDGFDGEQEGQFLSIWTFFQHFYDCLGVPLFTQEQFLQALQIGQMSPLLSQVHVSLLRLIQADMEESHATGATQGGMGPGNGFDRAIISFAHLLEEAWAWGFDVDAWRAHINQLTWPEVLRQFAIVAAWGSGRPRTKKDAKPKVGEEGEDVLDDTGPELKLRCPNRLGPNSIKAAAWIVLSEADHEGLAIPEIARRIQKSGLRDLRTSKTPEASVAGALSRDAVFCRVQPATYALQSIVTFHKKHCKKPKGEEQLNDKGDQQEEEEHDDASTDSEDEDGSEKRKSHEKLQICVGWVTTLVRSEYEALSLQERVDILYRLILIANEGPSLRKKIEERMEQSLKLRRQLQEEDKKAKRMKQARLAAKARQQKKESEAKLLQMRQCNHHITADQGSAPGTPTPNASCLQGCSDEGDPKSLVDQVINEAQQHAEEDERTEAARKKRRIEAVTEFEQRHCVRIDPVGLDRRYNKYWRFMSSSPDDKCKGRIFIELADNNGFLVVSRPEQLKAALFQNGVREHEVRNSLQSFSSEIYAAQPVPSLRLPINTIHTNQTDITLPNHENSTSDLQTSYEEWIQHVTLFAYQYVHPDDSFNDEHYPESDSPKFRKLKIDMLKVELALPYDAVAEETWTDEIRNEWIQSVQQAREASQLRKLLGDLEAVILPSCVSKSFNRTPLLVKSAWLSVGREVACALPGPQGEVQRTSAALMMVVDDGAVPEEHLGWYPPTLSALFLRLLSMDAALVYRPDYPPARDTMAEYKFIQRPSQVSDSNAFNETMRVVCEVGFMDTTEGGLLNGATQVHGKQIAQLNFPPLSQEVLTRDPQEFDAPIDLYRLQLNESGGSATQQQQLLVKPDRGSSKVKGKKYKPRKSKLLVEFDNMSNEEDEEVNQGDEDDDQDDEYEDFIEYLPSSYRTVTPDTYQKTGQQNEQMETDGLDANIEKDSNGVNEQEQQQVIANGENNQFKSQQNMLNQQQLQQEVLNDSELAQHYDFMFGEEEEDEGGEQVDDQNDPDY